jgi:hypothetical protein
MKRKIQANFKSYQKILLLILILLATLLFGFINGSIEGFLSEVSDESDDTSVERHKTAANERSSGDNKMKNDENNLYTTDDKLNSG